MLIPATSTAYIHVPVSGPDGVDVTDTPPRIAILASSLRTNPADEDWHDGEWVDGDARLLVGPDGGALTLPRGDYRVWVSFDPPGAELIVDVSGHLGII